MRGQPRESPLDTVIRQQNRRVGLGVRGSKGLSEGLRSPLVRKRSYYEDIANVTVRLSSAGVNVMRRQVTAPEP